MKIDGTIVQEHDNNRTSKKKETNKEIEVFVWVQTEHPLAISTDYFCANHTTITYVMNHPNSTYSCT